MIDFIQALYFVAISILFLIDIDATIASTNRMTVDNFMTSVSVFGE